MNPPRAMIDRVVHFIRMRGTAYRIAATPVAAVIVLELLGLAAWMLRDHWQVGRIELTNNGAPLTVHVLDESGDRPRGEPIDVIKKATLSLPDGAWSTPASPRGVSSVDNGWH